MFFHPLLIIVCALLLLQCLLIWLSSLRKRKRKWDDCPVCGAMIEMIPSKTADDEPILKGSCDNCYNHTTQFIDYDG